MRRTLLVSSTLLLSVQVACNPPKKGSSDTSGEPQNGDPGQVNVDTDPNQNTDDVKDDPNLNKDDLGTDETVGMAGKLAISTGLTDVAKPDQILAFPIADGELKSIGEVKKFPVDADGKFTVKLPKFDGSLARLLLLIKDGKVDREGLKKWLTENGHADSITEMLAKSDKQLIIELKAEAAKSKARSASFVLVSMVKSNKPEGRAKRAEEAATFAFIGLSAGGKNLFNIPVAAAKKGLFELGTITVAGDDAKSAVEADDKAFEFAKEALSQMAATGATLKAIKNDYVNLDPKSGMGYHASPFFLFQGNLLDVEDGYTTLDIGYKLETPPNAQVGYNGYGLYMRGQGKDPSHPTVDLMTKNLCGSETPDWRKFELLPPPGVAIKYTTGGSDEFTDAAPMGNDSAGTLEAINNNTRVQCSSSVARDLWYASGTKSTDPGLNWNWGSGGALQGSIPDGSWQLKIAGSAEAEFDLAAAQPLSPLENADLVANVFVPQIKVTTVDDFITKVDVRFSYFDATAATPGFVPVTNLQALRRGVSELMIEFDDYSGTRQGNRIDLSLVPDVAGVFSGDPTKGENPDPMKFPTGSDLDSERVADSISVTYKMYGNSYRFDFRRH